MFNFFEQTVQLSFDPHKCDQLKTSMIQVMPGYSFRKFLREELKNRIEANSQYSLRSFAKSLKVSPASLSMILNEKTPVSLKFIQKTCTQMSLGDSEIYKHQSILLKEKSKVTPHPEFSFIDANKFSLIKEWYNYAILNLMRIKKFKKNTHWISKKLKITPGEVQTAIENLKAAGLLKEENEKWIDTSSLFTSHTNNKTGNEFAKDNQKQLFNKACKAIDETQFEYRNHTGSTIAINIEDLDEAKKFITQFRKKFIKKFDQEKNADEVYHISVALFPLSHS